MNQLATSRNGLSNSLTPRRDDVFAPFESFFNQVFDGMWDDFSGLKSNARKGFPVLDVIVDNGKYIVEACVPGASGDNLSVEIEPAKETNLTRTGRILKISGRLDESHQYSDKAQYYKKELRRSSFERVMYLPDNVEGEPEATLKNGILKLVWDVPDLKPPEKKTVAIKCLD